MAESQAAPGGAGPGTSLLFVGDVVGGIGRHTLLDCLPVLRERHDPTFVIVNGENAAGGLGITPKIADQMFAAGVDVITLGNHTYHRREIYPYLNGDRPILRPANFLRSQPGKGAVMVERDGVRLGVVNLSGNLYLRAGRSAFTEVEVALGGLGEADQVLVDMHAEATSEKVAMGWHLDGRVTAVVGTHTHVPTADARVLPGGTAYITDVGMTGPRGGVIGVKREQAIEALAHADAGPLRDLRGGPVADGGPDQVLRAAARGVDRAGSDAASVSRRRQRAEAPQQGTIADREEPRDVQVEPVFHRQLDGEQDRRTARGQPDHVAAAGDHGQHQGEATREHLRGQLGTVPAVQPPDRERRVTVALVDQCALVDRVQRVVPERRDHGERTEHQKARREQRQ